MVLDRIEQIEADLRKLKSVPAIAKMIADHDKEEAEAAKKAKEAADKEAAKQQPESHDEGQGQTQDHGTARPKK